MTAAPPTEAATDRFATARAVADAVLYEGYVLYPYRASSRKNQVRFQWGVLMPRAYCEADPSERWSARTECLLDPRGHGGTDPVLHVRVRCLQTQRRRVEAMVVGDTFRAVDALEVDGTRHVGWDEAIDSVVDLPALDLSPVDLPAAARSCAMEHAFSLEDGSETELVRAADGSVRGRFVRERLRVDGVVRVAVQAAPTPDAPYRAVTVTVENATPWRSPGGDGAGDPNSGETARSDVMAASLVAVHTMLAIDGAAFVSLLDPPDDAAELARGCRSDGTYPVLVGDETVVLSSPIILYDHPEVAEQSPGDLYDATEIDEILALRVMTLTDEEKAEARGTDARSAAIIDRCDALSPEAMGRLHGQMRAVEPDWPTLTTPGLADADGADGADGAPGADPGGAAWWDPAADASVDPWHDTVVVDGVELGQGAPVRLHPSGRSDAQDMFLDGRCGTVAGVFADVDGGFHLAVTLDDDPAADELVWQGRYLYFHPEEVEPLAARAGGEEEQTLRGRVLVAGIGNVFLSDDAFGVEVAHRLAGRTLPEGVRVEDYGIRGIHLAYELLEGYETLVLVDAVPMGEPPGTLAVIEPDTTLTTTPTGQTAGGPGGMDPEALDVPAVDAHTMSPDVVLATLARLGGTVGRIVIVGCQPAELAEGMGLSPAVAAVVDAGADLCVEVIESLAVATPRHDQHPQPAEGGTPR